MPCNSDYLNPTAREAGLREAAHLLEYLRREKGEIVSPRLQAAARDPYCKFDYVADLCAAIKALTPEEENAFIWNNRSKDARTLANWWERHQRADAERNARQARAERKAELLRSAKAKLTEEEWQAVISRS